MTPRRRFACCHLLSSACRGPSGAAERLLPRARRVGERGQTVLRTLGLLLCTAALLALLAVVAYLLSEINTRRYRLNVNDDGLTIERGRFLPLGFERYQPTEDLLRRAYLPIEMPPGETIDTQSVYDDRSELDRALFGALRSWAQPRLGAQDAATLTLGIGYVKRLELLPGLSEGQRHELRAMRADAALKQAEGLFAGVQRALNEAEQLFLQAIELGTSDPERARRGAESCRRKLAILGVDAPPPAAAPPTPALWPEPGDGGAATPKPQ